MKKQVAPQPRSVDFALNDIDLEVALLGEAGWHTRAIAAETQLTEGQVTYRLGLAGVKRANYRNGKSDMATFIVGVIRARHSAKERIREVRELPEKFEYLQEHYAEVCSDKRKPKKGSN